MEIKKKRVGNDLIIRLTLKDSGVAVSWSGVDILSAQMYSDAQRVMAGFCDTEIDAEDATVLLVRYGANEPQYLGVNRLVMSFIYEGATVTYDCPVVKYVSLTEEEGTETISSVSATVTASGSVDLDLEVDALTAYIKPEGGIPESDLAQAVKDKLNRSSSAATWGSITGTLASQTDLNTELGKKYAKPSGGIPENDLAQAVKTKLNAGGTFTVSIRETPYADILAAINAGKIPVTDELADRYVFGGLSGSVIYFFQADPNSLFFVTVDEDDEWLDGELPLTGLYVKPGTGIPESDLAQAVKNKLAGGAGAVRHDVDQSLQLSDQAKSTARQNINADEKMATATSQPSGGFKYNAFYNLGVLSGSHTFALATTTSITDECVIQFSTGATAPSITWFEGVSWYGGSAPTINANKSYRIAVCNGLAICGEF